MIGSYGGPDSGKTEFAFSAPGPGQAICLDRGIDGVLNNPEPPASRQPRWAYKVITVPLATQTVQKEYLKYWQDFYKEWLDSLSNPDTRSVLLDGDSDSWELQRLAEFGKLTQIPSIMYTQVNAARRGMYARAYDSGKIVLATSKVKKRYVDAWNADGSPSLDSTGKQKREWNGEYERQGFDDQEYTWDIQLLHDYREKRVNTVSGKETPAQFGIKITKCKVRRALVGLELWGNDCNLQTLLELVYPNVLLKEWGY